MDVRRCALCGDRLEWDATVALFAPPAGVCRSEAQPVQRCPQPDWLEWDATRRTAGGIGRVWIRVTRCSGGVVR